MPKRTITWRSRLKKSGQPNEAYKHLNEAVRLKRASQPSE